MLNIAQIITSEINITFQAGFGHETNLPSGCADIITGCQSLHWMDPIPTFNEIIRLLRPGGVFAAVDYDLPPTTLNWEADAAYERFVETASRVYQTAKLGDDVNRWEKREHLTTMNDSRFFRYMTEMMVHEFSPVNSERLVGLALSMGVLETALKNSVSENELGLDLLRTEERRILGDDLKPWLWSAYIRLGIK